MLGQGIISEFRQAAWLQLDKGDSNVNEPWMLYCWIYSSVLQTLILRDLIWREKTIATSQPSTEDLYIVWVRKRAE